jgi:formylglycine-generating enzyme required for sulfatase activity
LTEWLRHAYETHPRAGVHGAARWLIKQRGEEKWLADADRRLTGQLDAKRDWFVNTAGICMIIVRGERPADLDSLTPLDFDPREPDAWRRVPWSFAIAMEETTWAQLHAWRESLKSPFSEGPQTGDYAVYGVAPWRALDYCRAISVKCGFEDDRQAVRRTGASEVVLVDPRQPGYRLPLLVEFQRACRAGTTTSRYYGTGVTPYASRYAQGNDRTEFQRVGQLLPNQYGLCDTLGNVHEVCIDVIATDSKRFGDRSPFARVIGRGDTTLAYFAKNSFAYAPRTCMCEFDRISGIGASAPLPTIGFRIVCGVPHVGR